MDRVPEKPHQHMCPNLKRLQNSGISQGRQGAVPVSVYSSAAQISDRWYYHRARCYSTLCLISPSSLICLVQVFKLRPEYCQAFVAGITYKAGMHHEVSYSMNQYTINFQGMILTIKIPRASFQKTKTKLRQ